MDDQETGVFSANVQQPSEIQMDIDQPIQMRESTSNIPPRSISPINVSQSRTIESALFECIPPKRSRTTIDVDRDIVIYLKKLFDINMLKPATDKYISDYINRIFSLLPTVIKNYPEEDVLNQLSENRTKYTQIIQDKFKELQRNSTGSISYRMSLDKCKLPFTKTSETLLLSNLFSNLPRPNILESKKDSLTLATHIPICRQYLQTVGLTNLKVLYAQSNRPKWVEIPFENIVDCLQIGIGFIDVIEYVKFLEEFVTNFLEVFVYIHTGINWFYPDFDPDQFTCFIINSYLYGYTSALAISIQDNYRALYNRDITSERKIMIDDINMFKSYINSIHKNIQSTLFGIVNKLHIYHGVNIRPGKPNTKETTSANIV